jgi:cellulose synthase/poly-beta-1,6-N-acetylglucosamine synthase-like glycosyltransferase/spore germination protein YaaH/peptidoglycan/xylan/chitin deacetylase (PgdA/CDA1 family)
MIVMNNNRQIFQTNNTARWKRFKWGGRIVAVVVLFFITTVVLAVILARNPSLPNIEAKGKVYENAMNPSALLTIKSAQNEKLKGFKEFLEKKDSLEKIKPTVQNSNFIRAAFYTPWYANSPSYKSLVQYGRNLNLVFPEWYFIKPDGGLDARADAQGLAVMRKYGMKIVPMLSNFNSSIKNFDGKLINELLHNEQKQELLIRQLADTLTSNQFNGINIDFEEINQPSDEYLTAFIKKLYGIFHPKGLLVTIDIAVNDTDYNLDELDDYTDYIVLMAYDEHSDATDAGPISSQKWIEAALDNAAKTIDSKKIILGVAAYGRDWMKEPDGTETVTDITYAEAVSQAKLSNATIDFNNDTYNLSFAFNEKLPQQKNEINKHEVWFTDAATTFNILRFSDEYGTAGTAMWRLGSEDRRIWNFYARSLTNSSVKQTPFDYKSFQYLPFDLNQKPTAIGEGELLNVLYTPQQGKATVETDTAEQLITEQQYVQLPSGYVYEKFAEDTLIGKGHKIVLTFDDGPSAEYTPQILSILEKENVPATFFIVGLNAQQNIPLLQRIYRDGYEIGNHTYTHSNIATMSPERAAIEMKTTRLLIESITGRSTILFRAPYNADSQPQTYEEIEPIARSKNENYITVGESIDPNDWDEEHITADSIVNRIIRQFEADNASIILLHDAGGKTRQATVDALPKIIQYFKSKGCRFTTVADLMGKTKDDVMPLVKANDRWIDQLNFLFAEFIYWGGKIVFALFLIGIALSVGRMIAMAILAYLQNKREVKENKQAAFFAAGNAPLVSIIVPAYNEQLNAVRTVNSLLKQDYTNLQIIFVDDGSKDETFARVNKAFETETRVKVFTKPNGGKASALNYGIEHADGDFLVCIDADTQLKTDAVTELMKKFTDIHVGAVAGNVKVGNEINMLTRWQSIEYITSQNFDRRAFDLLNCITVVPGAIGAFRKEAIRWAGGFTTDTLAEDADLTMRLLRKGYIIRNCTTAISYTEAPETLKQFLKQRFRWSYGIMQSFWKHRDAAFNPSFKNFGMIALPNILIFQVLLTAMAPLADFILLISLLAAGLGIVVASIPHLLLYYFIFTLVDMAGAALAFGFEKEDYKKLFWLLPQRLVYRQLMYYILFKSIIKALKGEAQGWGALKRTGNVKPAA